MDAKHLVPGTRVVEQLKLHAVEIDGRGGDSVHTEYYEQFDDAVVASVFDGPNRNPKEVTACKLSDGTIILSVEAITVEKPRSEEEKQRILMNSLRRSESPAVRLLLSK